jgi:hypothetical protein
MAKEDEIVAQIHSVAFCNTVELHNMGPVSRAGRGQVDSMDDMAGGVLIVTKGGHYQVFVPYSNIASVTYAVSK